MTGSSSQDSLKSAMREALEGNGTITQVKAELRAAVFQSLSDTTLDPNGPNNSETAHPAVPPENLVINELIKEYLTFNGLEHTLSVFQLEARVPDAPVPRRVLMNELNLSGAPTSVPLLYAMLHEAHLSKEMN